MFYAFSPLPYFIPIRHDLISNDIIFPKIDKITTRYFHWSTFCKNDLHSSCNWSDYKAVLICANMNHFAHKRMISVFLTPACLALCPTNCHRVKGSVALLQLYLTDFIKSVSVSPNLKAGFYFDPTTFVPLSLSPAQAAIFKGADADKVDEVQFDVFCFNLLAHSSAERV